MIPTNRVRAAAGLWYLKGMTLMPLWLRNPIENVKARRMNVAIPPQAIIGRPSIGVYAKDPIVMCVLLRVQVNITGEVMVPGLG
jgi:hypothetical protein